MSTSSYTDHDGLFKELFCEFFADFLKAFFPSIFDYLNLEQLDFLQQELIIQPRKNRNTRADLVVKVKPKGQEHKGTILVHIENQIEKEEDFAKRMFKYFQRLDLTKNLPVIPIVVFAPDHVPLEEEPSQYIISFPFGKVLQFNFFKVELKKLYWRNYLDSNNPVALALMGKMLHDASEKIEMKFEFLTRIIRLNLDSEKLETLVGFFDVYVKLTEKQTKILLERLAEFESEEVVAVQRIITSWEKRGRQEGVELGRQEGVELGRREGQIKVLVYQLKERFGSIPLEFEDKFRSLPPEELMSLSGKLLHVSSLAEFTKFLN